MKGESEGEGEGEGEGKGEKRRRRRRGGKSEGQNKVPIGANRKRTGRDGPGKGNRYNCFELLGLGWKDFLLLFLALREREVSLQTERTRERKYKDCLRLSLSLFASW